MTNYQRFSIMSAMTMTSKIFIWAVQSQWLFLCVVTSLLLAGCQKPASTNDLQGTWIPNKDSSKWVKATNTCEIILQTNGAFTATVPDYLMKTSDKCSGLVMSGKGQWLLTSKPLQTFIKLNFTEVDGQQIDWGAKELEFQKGDKNLELFFYVGEEGGDRFVFERSSK
jgi:hypothetical protein